MDQAILDEFKSKTTFKRQARDLAKRFVTKKYIAKVRHKNLYGEPLSLTAPKNLCEKITWMKFYYAEDPLVIQAGDKFGIREYLTNCGLAEFCPPFILNFARAEELPWEALPNECVIKKTNASGQNLILKNKAANQREDVVKVLKHWEKQPYSYECGEPHYDKMYGGFIVEPYHEEFNQDWKLLCFNGRFELLHINFWYGDDIIGHRKQTVCLADETGKIKNILSPHPDWPYEVGDQLSLPPQFSVMKEVASKIAQDFPLVRVDYFFVGEELYIGELTFTPYGGLSNLPEEISAELGAKLTLPLETLPEAFNKGRLVKRHFNMKNTLRTALPNEVLTHLKYFQYFHRPLRLKNAETLAEKLNWLKLYYAKEKRVAFAGDKITMRDYVKEKNLGFLLTKELATFKQGEELVALWHELPQSFVIKKSNASGQNILVKNKAALGLSVVLNEINKWSQTDFSKVNGEGHYKEMLGDFIIEEYVPNLVSDVKLLYMNGRLAFYQKSFWGEYYTVSERKELVVSISNEHIIENLDDEGWSAPQPFFVGQKVSPPPFFEQMVTYCEQLAGDFPFVRIDFLIGEDRLYLGELTFTPCAGLEVLNDKIQEKYGQMLCLPQATALFP